MTRLWISMGLVLLVLSFMRLFWRRGGSVREKALHRAGYPTAGQATMADVERLVRAGERIMAIRCYQEIYNVGLVEAKKAIDDLQLPPNQSP